MRLDGPERARTFLFCTFLVVAITGLAVGIFDRYLGQNAWFLAYDFGTDAAWWAAAAYYARSWKLARGAVARRVPPA